MRFYEIGGGILPEMEIALTHSKKKARKAIRKAMGREQVDAFEESSGDACTTFITDAETGDRRYLIWMTNTLEFSAAQDAALLCHEAVHVVSDYLQSIGEDEPGDELVAYAVQFVAQNLIELHFDWKKRKIGD